MFSSSGGSTPIIYDVLGVLGVVFMMAFCLWIVYMCGGCKSVVRTKKTSTDQDAFVIPVSADPYAHVVDVNSYEDYKRMAQTPNDNGAVVPQGATSKQLA